MSYDLQRGEPMPPNYFKHDMPVKPPPQPKAVATLQTTWEPTGDYLMLQPILLPEVSDGGIILPGSAYRKTNRGVVIRTGTLAQKDLIGRECFFPANVDYTIEIEDGQQVYLVREQDIIMHRPSEP